MNRCPLTYMECGNEKYSLKGLHRLSPQINHLEDFPFTQSEQREEAIVMAGKISIQGVQPKLSVKLNIKKCVFEILERGGKYIIKPQSHMYPELPENEDLTMRLAQITGIEVPVHGLIYSKDASLSYVIKRFDRIGRNRKLPVEDFAQLAGETRETKYNYSMEKIVNLLNHCTFPMIEKVKLFRLTLFNYLVGNEDMHLKNFSLINRESKIELSPSYDLINTTIALKNPTEEIALPLNGKKRNLTSNDLIDYFGKKRLQLTDKVIDKVIMDFNTTFERWYELINISFLSQSMKRKYSELVKSRRAKLGI